MFFSRGSDKTGCLIEDNGIGRKAATKLRGTGHNSKRYSLVKERLAIIGKIRGKEFRMKISDINPERIEPGTRVEIEIPAGAMKGNFYHLKYVKI